MRLPYGTQRFARYLNGMVADVLIDLNDSASRLFPPTADDTTTPIGAAENAGDITTKDIATFVFPNTFLTFAGGCCVLGFHSYDSEPADASTGNIEKRPPVAVAEGELPEQPRERRRHRGSAQRDLPDDDEWLHRSPAERADAVLVRPGAILERPQWHAQLSR